MPHLPIASRLLRRRRPVSTKLRCGRRAAGRWRKLNRIDRHSEGALMYKWCLPADTCGRSSSHAHVHRRTYASSYTTSADTERPTTHPQPLLPSTRTGTPGGQTGGKSERAGKSSGARSPCFAAVLPQRQPEGARYLSHPRSTEDACPRHVRA